MYRALDIAYYIIDKCIELGRPISNLQLQKLLYYTQGQYMRVNNGEVLFEEDIMAWPYGPVVPEVYYEFNSYSSSSIDVNQCEYSITDSIKEIIDPVIEDKSLLSAWKLVEETHNELPWKDSYCEEGPRSVISKQLMKDFFCAN